MKKDDFKRCKWKIDEKENGDGECSVVLRLRKEMKRKKKVSKLKWNDE